LKTDAQGGDGVLNLGSLSMTGCNISNNSATGSGGGLAADNATTTLTNCTISGNHAVGSLAGGLTFLGGSANLIGCTISGNAADEAGGLLGPNATVSLTNCTIAGNSAASGGVVVRTGSAVVTLTNCTVSGNSSSNGSALRNNTGLADRLVLNNTIVAGQTVGWDILGPASGSNNLIGTGGSGGLVNGVNGNLVGVANPLLAPLGFYGGPTQTMPLLPGSPAIDAGNTALISGTTGQRGLPRTVNGTVDIGAFESSGFTIAVVSSSDQMIHIFVALGATGPFYFAPLVVRVTANNPIEPVAGGLVTFVQVFSAGGSATTLSGNPATIQSDGTASVNAAVNTYGDWTVSATARGITSPAYFNLHCKPPPGFGPAGGLGGPSVS
jgi:hypothetical protein